MLSNLTRDISLFDLASKVVARDPAFGPVPKKYFSIEDDDSKRNLFFFFQFCEDRYTRLGGKLPTRFTSKGDFLKQCVADTGIAMYERDHPGVPHKSRQEMINDFNFLLL